MEFFVEITEKYGREAVLYSVRKAIEDVKNGSVLSSEKDAEKIIQSLSAQELEKIFGSKLKKIINATGVIIHTNLGRAPLGEEAVKEISEVCSGYCDLEFDLTKGKRGKRLDCVEDTLKFLTGAESVAVVNNNAAALMLVLGEFAKKKEVIVSRGELVEIGGSFRIPEILKASGAKMIEVGTTNRTRISDYAGAACEKTAMFLKVHKSNYVIKGFTEETSLSSLIKLSAEKKIPLLYDLGSGCVDSSLGQNLYGEPDIKSAVKSGAHFVTFSGDKLFGGPQAGIICGRREDVEKLKKAPMMRAFRVGKLTLAALGSVAVMHALNSSIAAPAVKMILSTEKDLRLRAEKLTKLLKERGFDAYLEKSAAQSGGGSLTDIKIDSYCAALDFQGKKDKTAEKIYFGLMREKTPIVSVLRKGNLVFDVMTINERDLCYIAESVLKISENIKRGEI
ncbi:L-seryl-tRNA(Sec) selenium transferase [candidate division WOR-3 bacterium]|nr:L-seryl-tRNA(Sec) selenium transferase [candidate division WOR-3 bacterium]